MSNGQKKQSATILLALIAFERPASADDQPSEGVHPIQDSARGFRIGDSCEDSCSVVLKNSYCNLTTNTCQCLDTHPIAIEGFACVDGKRLEQSCEYDIQCTERTPESYCHSSNVCSCRQGFYQDELSCVPDGSGPLSSSSVPALAGLCLCLSLLLLLLCLLLRLFSSARWARTRRWADAGRDPEDGNQRRHSQQQQQQQGSRKKPPAIMLQGEDAASSPDYPSLDIEKQLYRPALSNSRNNSLTASGGQSLSSGGGGLDSRRTSGQLLAEWPPGFTDADSGDFEQYISIVPNPKARRRGSMADHAFPELHHSSKAAGSEPENLLILTRTRTDRHGRRHSVAVPLVPPPDGQKFEGGYHVERNPITGGAKLVPPPGDFGRRDSKSGSTSPSKSGDGSGINESGGGGGGRAKVVKRHRSRDDGKHTSGAQKASLPKHLISVCDISHSRSPSAHSTTSAPGGGSSSAASGESAPQQPPPKPLSQPPPPHWQISRKGSKYRNRTIAGMPTIGEGNGGGAGGGSGGGRGSRGLRDRHQHHSLRVPHSGRGRRHSIQVGGGGTTPSPNSLAKDMERLRVREGSYPSHLRGASSNGSATNPPTSPRPLRRKPSSSRRSSKAGFLHFLDLAIAN